MRARRWNTCTLFITLSLFAAVMYWVFFIDYSAVAYGILFLAFLIGWFLLDDIFGREACLGRAVGARCSAEVEKPEGAQAGKLRVRRQGRARIVLTCMAGIVPNNPSAFPPLHLDVQVPRSTGRARAAILGGQMH